MGIFDKGVKNTNRSFFDKLSRAIVGHSRVDDSVLDAMEEALVETDMGVDTTLKIIDNLEERVSRDKYMSLEELTAMLREEIAALLKVDEVSTAEDGSASGDGSSAGDAISAADGGAPSSDSPKSDLERMIDPTKKPYVILVVGVNGVGKTTTIGKIASKLARAGKKVVLGAADTFRAAAVDQLVIWAERAGVDIVRQEMGADPASVAYDSVKSAVAKGADVVIIDTAGRLHNRVDLMNELTKIRNVISKVVPDGPNEVLLVLDASTGQNAFQQAREFSRATKVTSLALTKLDGSAKGGVVVGIVDQLQIPLKYIGIGEGVDDLKLFDRKEFAASLFDISSIK